MEQIIFTIMTHWSSTSSALALMVDEFEQHTGIRVKIRQLDWQTGRRELVRIALDRSGADVSEIGSTWLSELTMLNVIRPFDQQEQNGLGIPQDYFPLNLKNCGLFGDSRLWAVPWISEALVLIYRKDLLRNAGLFPDTAFRDLASLQITAQRLRDCGVPIPIAIPGRNDRFLLLQNLSSWLWQSGSDYILTDGSHYSVNLDPLVDAASSYFSLLHACTPEGQQILNSVDTYTAFHKGYAAASLGGLWLNRISPGFTLPEVARELAIARLSGPTFTGGSNLIVWQNSLHVRAALEFVKYLTSDNVARIVARESSYIPARWTSASKTPEFQTPAYQLFAQAVEKGRSYPNLPLWGAVEDLLSNALTRIWDGFFANPEVDLKQLVSQTFIQVNSQLDPILARVK